MPSLTYINFVDSNASLYFIDQNLMGTDLDMWHDWTWPPACGLEKGGFNMFNMLLSFYFFEYYTYFTNYFSI